MTNDLLGMLERIRAAMASSDIRQRAMLRDVPYSDELADRLTVAERLALAAMAPRHDLVYAPRRPSTSDRWLLGARPPPAVRNHTARYVDLGP